MPVKSKLLTPEARQRNRDYVRRYRRDRGKDYIPGRAKLGAPRKCERGPDGKRTPEAKVALALLGNPYKEPKKTRVRPIIKPAADTVPLPPPKPMPTREDVLRMVALTKRSLFRPSRAKAAADRQTNHHND